MTGVENSTTKVYSADKKLWVGMKVEDAYKDKEVFELFNFANTDDDKSTLSEEEIRRYNGPRLIVEKDDKTKQRFIGHYSGFRSAGTVAGNIINSKEFEFYPGMKYEQVAEQDFNLEFRDLDIDSDGELSTEEIQKYQAYVDRKNQYKQTVEYNEYTKNNNQNKSFMGGFWGAVAGGIGGYKVTGVIVDKAYEYVSKNPKFKGNRWNYNEVDWNKVPKALDKLIHEGSGCWAIALGITALGIGAGLLIANHFKKDQKPTDEFNDLKQLDEQYKHVYNA